jgi:APA family basic amino acid/polyamine antiporter
VKKHVVKLRRELSMAQAMLSGIGIILGAGIYALVGKAAGLAGNAVWLSFLLSAVVAGLTGLSYAELSSMFPKAGAEYVYSRRAFGERIAFLIGWLIIIGGIIASVTVSLGFAGYFSALTGSPLVPAAMCLIAALSLLIFWGIRLSAMVAIAMTLIEAAGLFMIIAIGAPYLGSVDYLAMPSGLSGVFTAAALIFFAFIGFEEITRLSEETKRPERAIPRALLVAIAVTTVIYVMVSLSAVSVLGWEKLSTSHAPLADVAAKAFGPGAFTLLATIALFSTTNTVLLMLLATSRITYGIAAERSLPRQLALIHRRRRTPWVAIALVGLFAALLTLAGKIETMAMLTDFTVFFTFVAINLSLVWLRYKEPSARRPFRVPLDVAGFPLLALLGAFFSLLMLLNVGIEMMTYGAGLVVAGIIAHAAIRARPRR